MAVAKGKPLIMLAISLRLPSRGLIRTFSSSPRRLDHFPNVDQKVWGGETLSTRSQLIFVRYQGFEKALQVKDKIVIADFYAEYASSPVR